MEKMLICSNDHIQFEYLSRQIKSAYLKYKFPII